MVVIIRELRSIGGSPPTLVKVYKPSDLPVTNNDITQAEELDKKLEEKMKQIEKEMKKLGYLKFKGRRGTVRLWYEVGKRLAPFIESSDLKTGEKKYIWRAIYDHVEELKPGEPKVRANERPEDSHFSYCCKLADFEWDFVEKVGDWTTWYELFDSTLFKNDKRLLEWLSKKQPDIKGSLQDWIRDLKKYDTKVFTDDELFEKLDKIFQKVHG